MKLSNFYTLLLVIFVAWASLFATVLIQSHRTNLILKNDNVLLTQQKETLNSISFNAKIRTQQINNLQSHIDCLFNLATRPNHSSSYIADANQCLITVPKTQKPAPTPAKTTQPSSTSSTANDAQPNPTPNPAPKPKPAKSAICKLTKLLC